MPSVRRRIVVLLAVACLGSGGLASLAFAQGAGDQQYQDPFGGSGTSTTQGSSGSTSGSTTTTPDGDLQPLSPSPQNGGSSGSGGSAGSSDSSGSSGSAATTPAAPATPAAGLPNTGADTRLLALAGAALLLIGLGLRLRSAPERF